MNRWFPYPLTAFLVILSCTGCDQSGTAPLHQVDKLKVQELVLTDSKGQQRAWIGLEQDQPSILLFDDAGRIRMGLGLDADGSPQIGLSNVAGVPVLNLAMDADGNMGLLVVNEEGLPRVVSGVGSDGKARTDLYSQTGFRIFSATD